MKNWQEIKQYFIAELTSIYDSAEVEQIFFMILEDCFALTRINYSFEKKEVPKRIIVEQINAYLEALKTNEPIQHILGYAYFFERKFIVTKDVLIPRQETEALVYHMVKKHSGAPLEILDIGTGSGSIPITLKLESPKFNISTLDVSEKALEIAKQNALQLKAEVNFIKADILNHEHWPLIKDKSLDLIVSNPPYVRELEKEQMHKNVVDFDPELALYVPDEDPLVFYQTITEFAVNKLNKGGFLYFEINEVFGPDVKALMEKQSFSNVIIIKDMQEKDRFVCGQLH